MGDQRICAEKRKGAREIGSSATFELLSAGVRGSIQATEGELQAMPETEPPKGRRL
jgi:hypothetical protein